MNANFAQLILDATEKIQRENFEAAIIPMLRGLELNPLGEGAADSLFLVGTVNGRLLFSHQAETSFLLSYRLRGTLIDPSLEFDNLVNLTQACLNLKSFEEAYQYGIIAETIKKEDYDLTANLIVACSLTDRLEEAKWRFEKLKNLSLLHANEVHSFLRGKGEIPTKTYQLSCDDLIDRYWKIERTGDLTKLKEWVQDLEKKPDGINSWKCWELLGKYYLSMLSRNPYSEYLILQNKAGLAAASGKAIAFHPQKAEDSFNLWLWRGKSLGEMCFFKLAVEALEKALIIEPANKEAKDGLNYCRKMADLPGDHPERPDSISWIEKVKSNANSSLKYAPSDWTCPKCGSNKIVPLDSTTLICDLCTFLGAPNDFLSD